ncbi:PKD domain-containing protein [Myxococcus stipitatus]|uniref:carboxylesterase family protein n=1 Tax=Myxococcus stipitatus TaxID=83455 RepID=UPI0030D1BE4B
MAIDIPPGTHSLAASVKIPITASMVRVDSVRPAMGPYEQLFDEQDAIGDPRAGTGAKPTTTWGSVVYDANAYPMGFYIDLGATYDVTEVGVFDTYATGDASFDVGEPGAWVPAVNFSTDLWEKWKLFSINKRTRYVRFARTLHAGVNEIVVYGSPVDPLPGNVPPSVSAGATQELVLPTSTATLSGTASDSDGTIVSRQWVQTQGPSIATLTNATSLTATASGLVQGSYIFELTVTDDDGASSSNKTTVKVLPAAAGRGTVTEVYRSSSTPGGFGYVLYLPPGYAEGSNWPLVVFLHGMGQRGNGGPDELKRVRELGPPRYIDAEGKDYPFVMVAPQTGPNGTWGQFEAEYYLGPFVNHIQATLNVDPRRTYMTGLSLGGGGAISFASVFPNKLAAILAACPTSWAGAQSYSDGMMNAGLAVWAVHARNDATYSYNATASWFDQFGKAMGGTRGVLATYTSPNEKQTAFFRPGTGDWQWHSGQTATDSSGAGPARPVLFTVYDTGGHAIWDAVYKDPKVWDWLLAQQKP